MLSPAAAVWVPAMLSGCCVINSKPYPETGQTIPTRCTPTHGCGSRELLSKRPLPLNLGSRSYGRENLMPSNQLTHPTVVCIYFATKNLQPTGWASPKMSRFGLTIWQHFHLLPYDGRLEPENR